MTEVKIGSLLLENMTVLAPLAGITNLPFRLLAKEAGCGLVCTEMISSNGLVHNSARTLDLLKSQPEEKPLSVQIFGSEPTIMAEAAAMTEASGADVLDINLGCAVKKILKTGSGVALMKNPQKVKAILQAVRKVVRIPMTIKIRAGWDNSGSQAYNIAEIAQDCGVDAIVLHPRTATQGFRGRADWSLIAAIKKKLAIPVIGNGDIEKPHDAIRMKRETDCDALMIGRAAIGNPWIFSQVLSLLGGNEIAFPDLSQRFDTMIRYTKSLTKYLGEHRACLVMRTQLGWFVKGLRYSSRFRESIKQISTEKEALTLMEEYKRFLFDKGF